MNIAELETGKLYRITWPDPNHPGCPGLVRDCPRAEYVGTVDIEIPAGQLYMAQGANLRPVTLALRSFVLRADTRETPPGQDQSCTWQGIGQTVHIADELLTAESIAEGGV